MSNIYLSGKEKSDMKWAEDEIKKRLFSQLSISKDGW
jgi:hypothetical protein